MHTTPYGSWPSPVTAESLVTGQVTLDEVRVDGPDTYWTEGRPWEGGRSVLVRHDGRTGETHDVVGPGWNVRSRVHEYGGGPYAVAHRVVVFSSFDDGRIYRVTPDAPTPEPITPEGAVRFGGLVRCGTRVLAVREDHRQDGEAVNTLVELDIAGDNPGLGRVLWSGSDFVGRPAVSADGRRVAVVTWDHPSMPWDSTVLRLIELADDGSVASVTVVAGGEGVSVVQPVFAPDGRVLYCSDEGGFWNLWAHDGSGPERLHTVDADVASAQWMLGMADLALLDDGRVVVRRWDDAFSRLSLLDPATGEVSDLPGPGCDFSQIWASGGEIAMLAADVDRLPAVVRGTPGGVWRTLRETADRPLDAAYVSPAEPWHWVNSEGLDVHGLLHRPRHADHVGPDDELPPLIVTVHGGPTSQVRPSLSILEQFWTTRGFAVLAVDYSGSSGRGRAYRDRLQGRWGDIDNDDIITGARSLADAGIVDGDRLAIRGGSAGGYAVLRAMTTSDAFAAGVSYFGVADLAALAAETHKFESRYLDGLVAPLPEGETVYRQRSPIHHVEHLQGEVLLLQGADDLVVPVGQAEDMAAAMRAAGKAVELVVYPGEGHGFRGRDAIVDSLERELAFYGRVFGFTPV